APFAPAKSLFQLAQANRASVDSRANKQQYVMLLLPVEQRRIIRVYALSIDNRGGDAGAGGRCEKVQVEPLASFDGGRKDVEFARRGSNELQQFAGSVVSNRQLVFGTVRRTELGIKQTQVVRDFGNRGHCRVR